MLISHNAPDGDLNAEFNDSAWVSCPYCGEASELPVDLAGGSVQEYVEDCQVCCRPITLSVLVDENGDSQIEARTESD